MDASMATSSVADEGEKFQLSKRGLSFCRALDDTISATKCSSFSLRFELEKHLAPEKRLTEKQKDFLADTHKTLLDANDVKKRIEREVDVLTSEGHLFSSLAKLDEIYEAYKRSKAAGQKSAPKWRPYGCPGDDLRPYRMRSLRSYAEKLNRLSSAETLLNDKLFADATAKRQKVKGRAEAFDSRIDALQRGGSFSECNSAELLNRVAALGR